MFQPPTIQTPLADKLRSIELKTDISDVFKKGLLYYNDSPQHTNQTNSIQKIQKEILMNRLIKEDLPQDITEDNPNYTEINEVIKKSPKLSDELLHQIFAPDILKSIKSTLTLDHNEMIKDILDKEIKDNSQNDYDYPNNYFIYKICCGCVDLDRIDDFADSPRKD